MLPVAGFGCMESTAGPHQWPPVPSLVLFVLPRFIVRLVCPVDRGQAGSQDGMWSQLLLSETEQTDQLEQVEGYFLVFYSFEIAQVCQTLREEFEEKQRELLNRQFGRTFFKKYIRDNPSRLVRRLKFSLNDCFKLG